MTTTTPALRIKRVYDPPADDDGMRVLIDRLWPRGLGKASARIDLWLKEVAPSDELRRWFGHEPERWAEFQRRYREELKTRPQVLGQLTALAGEGRLTLLYAAKDQTRNNAVVLLKLLQHRLAAHAR